MAHLLIIELPGGNDSDILQAAAERGDSFTFLSAELAHYQKQPAVAAALASAYELLEVRPFVYAEVESRVLMAHARRPFDAVLCLIDTRMPEAASLARRLGLRHLNPEGAALLRDKAAVRQRLVESGIEQPAFALASSNHELKAAVERLGLPVLIKPVDGYGSQNIVVLEHPEDLDPLLSPLDDLLPLRADYGLGVRSNDRMLVERYLTGIVVGCDTFSAAGVHTLLGVHEKSFFPPPSFAIRGGSFSAEGPRHAAIQSYLFSLLDAVHFDWGAAHTELMLTAQGPRLIEINPRLVGAKIPRLVGLALERSVHQDLIALHLGDWSPAHRSSTQVAVTRWIVANRPGVIEQVRLPSWQDARVRRVELLKQAGDAVRPPFENADRLGCVMVCAATRAEAEQLADRYVSEVVLTLAA